MSNLERDPEAIAIAPGPAGTAGPAGVVHAVDVLEARKAAIGDGTEVRRLLPQRSLRTVGAWCFLDHYGPDDVSRGTGMVVPPHPHIGLQTASWLFDGQVLHRDSLGSQQIIRPGELNLMTSGKGIVHAEQSPRGRPALLHGLQLWIALPDADRFVDPSFAHHAMLPVVEERYGTEVTVVVGTYRGEESPAQVYSPLAAFEVTVPVGLSFSLAVNTGFEYAVVAADGPATVEGATIEPGRMAHLLPGLSSVTLEPSEGTRNPARFFVLGGEPFGERLLMWWNFVARTAEEIIAGRADWVAGRFTPVRGGGLAPLPAPELPAGQLRPR